jgi:redox-sensitive bicupin YhaK (pirin superfamily)
MKRETTLTKNLKAVSTVKAVVRIHQSSRTHWVGDGFPVRSVFGYNDLGKELSPFLLLDYAAPAKFEPTNKPRGVGAHPHRGFETVTVVYQGELEHRDSSGGGGKIGPGDVQWMTAASGLVHEEFHSRDFTRTGGTLQMAQVWVNLPAKDKKASPGYQTLLRRNIPSVAAPDGGSTMRVIAGQYQDAKGPARTFTPINLWDVRINAGRKLELTLPEGYTAALFVLTGEANLNEEKPAREGDLAIFARSGERIILEARTDTALLLLNGEPINEPVVGYGPFVMNTKEEIAEAFAEFENGRMGRLN